MSGNRLVFQGLDDFKRQLRQLPEELAGEAGHIVEGSGNAAAVAIRTAYGQHKHSGNLQDHVTVEHQSSGLAAKAVVKSTARHSHLFEHGSQARHTDLGWNRGAMPATPTFIPIVIRFRTRMYEELKGLLQRAGLHVKGDA